MHCDSCTQHKALWVHTLFPLWYHTDMPMPAGRTATVMLIWPQRDVLCSQLGYLQLIYASFSDETLLLPPLLPGPDVLLAHPTSVVPG